MTLPVEIGGAPALPPESRHDLENGRLSDENTLATERKVSFVKDDEESSSINRTTMVTLSPPRLRYPAMHVLRAAEEFRRLGRKRQHDRDELNLRKRLQYEKEIKSAGITQIGDIMDRILLLCEEATLTAAMERTGQLFRKLSKSGKGVGWIADGDFYSKSEKGKLLKAMTRACVGVTEGLTLYESSSNIQMAGIAAIAEAAQCTPMLAVLGYQCCSALDRAMRGMHKDEPQIQFAACYCIGAIAGTSHASKYIINSVDACSLVVSAMVRFGPTDRDVAAVSAWAVHSLGKCSKLREKFRDQGLILNIPLALQGILKAHSSDPDVHDQVNLCIAVLCVNDNVASTEFGAAGLVHSVMESLLKFRDNENVTLSALLALRNLSTTIVANREELKRSGLLEELFSILNTRVLDQQSVLDEDDTRPWDLCRVVERVSGCMYALAKDVHCAKELIRLGMRSTLLLAATKTGHQKALPRLSHWWNYNIMLVPVVSGLSVDEARRLSVIGEVAVSGSINDSREWIQRSFACRLGPWKWPLNESNTDEIVALMDEGGEKAIITVDGSIEQAKELVQWVRHHFPRDARSRLVARTDRCHNIEPFVEAVRRIVGTVQFVVGPEIDSIMLANSLVHVRCMEGSSEHLNVVFEMLETSEHCIGQLHKEFSVDVQCNAYVKDEATDSKMVEAPSSTRKGVDASRAFVACMKTERPDGLFTTVVCDASIPSLSGVALGLVYSNTNSIASAMACCRGVYWSRSRNSIWRKGDSSGAWQKLLRLDVDCDGDAIRATVIQVGNPPAFCHLNRLYTTSRRNCWREDTGLGLLERTLSSRKASAPSGSYTARLFGDKNLLRNKLVEEAQELAEAETPEEVASEAADLMYFLMARCVAAGVGMADIEGWLNKRALKIKRRPGNAKAHRIDVADAILATEKERKRQHDDEFS